MPDNPYWAAAKAAYKNQNREWIPCPSEFFEDMLNILPPVCFDNHPVLGCHFGVSEPWIHTSEGQPVFLMFRSKPETACRMATRREFNAERVTAIPADWTLLTPDEVNAICEQMRPGERGRWESDEFKCSVEKTSLDALYGDRHTYIGGHGWYVPTSETTP